VRRVVLDASTLVGALLKPDSTPRQALDLARGRAEILLSPAVEDELRRVLLRPRFRRYFAPGEAERFLTLVAGIAVLVEPVTAVSECRDPQDDKYLALALDGGAEVIVSSDKDLLALDPWRGIRILSPAEFVAACDA
jgi:uncharacterized protein